MKPINVEITMGHNIGISANYYRPSFEEVKTDYLKAVELLTFENNNSKLEKEISDLNEKNKENEYIISGKLQEKEMEMKELKEQQLDSAEAIAVLSDRLTKALEDIELLKENKNSVNRRL
jgi:hypothetical protein